MFVVIFRAKTRRLDTEYSQVAKRMRELALAKFGCLDVDADRKLPGGQYWIGANNFKANLLLEPSNFGSIRG